MFNDIQCWSISFKKNFRGNERNCGQEGAATVSIDELSKFYRELSDEISQRFQ